MFVVSCVFCGCLENGRFIDSSRKGNRGAEQWAIRLNSRLLIYVLERVAHATYWIRQGVDG